MALVFHSHIFYPSYDLINKNSGNRYSRYETYFLSIVAGSGTFHQRLRPPEPEAPPENSTVDRLAAPPLPAHPNQADLGAQVYYQVCMACHGDKGQGLTDEWRAVWGEDSYCWSSKCHGPNHPTQGFEFPQKSSPVIGSGTLLRFDNALELYDYLVKTMPWWNPGYLSREQYWQVTAFLMRAHDALPANIELDAGNAAVIHMRPASPIRNDSRPATILVIGILAVAAVIVIVEERIRHI